MMLPKMLAGKGALYVGVALSALLVVSNLGWWTLATVLRGDLRVCEADAGVVVTEREAWKSKAGELAVANGAGQKIVATLQGELEHAQGDARRLDSEGRAAIAAARADASAAARQLIAFRERYQRQRATPDCVGALEALQQHCTQFEGY